MALRSALPDNLLSAHGAHRYYSDQIEQTCSMVARLTTETEGLFAIESVYSDGFCSTHHSHDVGQVSFVKYGLMSIVTDTHSYVVPEGHAVWIPPHHKHQAQAMDEICTLSAYTGPSFLAARGGCKVFRASDILAPLLIRLIALQLRRETGPVHDALLLLLHEELATARRLDAWLPMPEDPRLRRVCEVIIREPTISNRKEELARIGNMSCRTMTRLFKKELDMTFLDWVQQTLVLSAVGRLSRGETIANVASDLGYSNPSAFTAMFRRRIGHVPSHFAARPQGRA